jgi:hypothetical protein
LAFQNSQIEVQSLNRRLRIRHKKFQKFKNIYKIRIKIENSASDITIFNQINNEENTTIEKKIAKKITDKRIYFIITIDNLYTPQLFQR